MTGVSGSQYDTFPERNMVHGGQFKAGGDDRCGNRYYFQPLKDSDLSFA